MAPPCKVEQLPEPFGGLGVLHPGLFACITAGFMLKYCVLLYLQRLPQGTSHTCREHLRTLEAVGLQSPGAGTRWCQEHTAAIPSCSLLLPSLPKSLPPLLHRETAAVSSQSPEATGSL